MFGVFAMSLAYIVKNFCFKISQVFEAGQVSGSNLKQILLAGRLMGKFSEIGKEPCKLLGKVLPHWVWETPGFHRASRDISVFDSYSLLWGWFRGQVLF